MLWFCPIIILLFSYPITLSCVSPFSLVFLVSPVDAPSLFCGVTLGFPNTSNGIPSMHLKILVSFKLKQSLIIYLFFFFASPFLWLSCQQAVYFLNTILSGRQNFLSCWQRQVSWWQGFPFNWCFVDKKVFWRLYTWWDVSDIFV